MNNIKMRLYQKAEEETISITQSRSFELSASKVAQDFLSGVFRSAVNQRVFSVRGTLRRLPAKCDSPCGSKVKVKIPFSEFDEYSNGDTAKWLKTAALEHAFPILETRLHLPRPRGGNEDDESCSCGSIFLNVVISYERNCIFVYFADIGDYSPLLEYYVPGYKFLL